MRRTDRLFDLIQILRDGRLHRASEMAARLGVSVRTIWRDVATLAASGLPVEGERGVGYILRAPITLPPMILNAVELEALRLGLRLAAPERLAAWKVLRVLPHGVDTLLLSTAIAMVVVGGIDLLQSPWLLAKIGALLVYIGLGTVALKRGRTRGVRLGAWLAALAVLLVVTFFPQLSLWLPDLLA